MTIVFNKDICHDLSKATEKEWLETNGIGGYASSTITGANTRRYHGLLMAATRPPLGRTLLLSKLEEFLCIDGKEYPLSTNIYPNIIYPEGYKNLVQFSLNPFPTFEYSVNGIDVKKIVFMVYGENTTVTLYQVNCRGERSFALALKVRVMVAFRDYHWLTHENPAFKTDYKILPNGGICLQPYEGFTPMYLFHNAEAMDKNSFWYKNMEYPKENERGLEFHEDHFSPFALHFDLNKRKDCHIVASTNEFNKLDVFELLEKETALREKENRGLKLEASDSSLQAPTSTLVPLQVERKKITQLHKSSMLVQACSLNQNVLVQSPRFNRQNDGRELGGGGDKQLRLCETLLSVSDSFIVKRESDKKSIIAGYHWFGDWGRDTMISLPGLTLVQGRFEDAREILLSFAQYVSKGMIPNRFPDYGETPEYNTVDASLWYIQAVYQYLRFAKDLVAIRKDLYCVLQEIVEYYQKGTRFNIHMDSDGLIYAGVAGVQLTWMDAKVGDWVVTPRIGKAVEINALWYNALKIMSFLAREMDLSNESKDYNNLAQKVSKSFNDAFWFDEGQYLYDYIDGETRSKAIRPNQVLAVSLPYSMLSKKRQRNVVEIVKEHLLTPYGLRSLSPKDKDYIGRYCGNVCERDRAYHQGTVWAWLIGPYISAYAKAYAGNKDALKYIKGLFVPFYEHLFDAGLGTVSEIFDGDPPHTPRGCISQAWSVAEILRTYFEHVYGFENEK
ncbi:MAG TPA: amylo-alpha-1,6-glucosidase [Candidatus Wunengus sp. YC63]|uniref:amylo-alpha-1,6-glucosidase n=1 Tax=unclassified Candidatus Wunengus TaxID=3367695 RepID=UPI004027A676